MPAVTTRYDLDHGGVNNGFFAFNGTSAVGQHHDGLPAPDPEFHRNVGCETRVLLLAHAAVVEFEGKCEFGAFDKVTVPASRRANTYKPASELTRS